MGTSTLYLRNTSGHPITDSGTTVTYDLLGAAGSAADTDVVTLTAGGDDILFTQSAGGSTISWISGRVPAGGMNLTSVDVSIWGNESNNNDNTGLGINIYRYQPGPTITSINPSGAIADDGTEMATDPGEMTWTVNVTDTAFAENDRLIIRVYAVATGSMTSGTATLTFNAAGGATGDSLITLTHTEAAITFKDEDITIRSKVMVGGAWKTVASAKVMVGGAWKSISSIKTMVNGAWKVT